MAENPIHTLGMRSRKELDIEGVERVESFNDDNIVVITVMGRLIIRGHNLHIQQLDLEKGRFSAQGEVDSLVYSQRSRDKGRGGSNWQKIWR